MVQLEVARWIVILVMKVIMVMMESLYDNLTRTVRSLSPATSMSTTTRGTSPTWSNPPSPPRWSTRRSWLLWTPSWSPSRSVDTRKESGERQLCQWFKGRRIQEQGAHTNIRAQGATGNLSPTSPIWAPALIAQNRPFCFSASSMRSNWLNFRSIINLKTFVYSLNIYQIAKYPKFCLSKTLTRNSFHLDLTSLGGWQTQASAKPRTEKTDGSWDNSYKNSFYF